MTEREAFQVGFMARCAEGGVSPRGAAGVAEFAVKRAFLGAVIDAGLRTAMVAPTLLWPASYFLGRAAGHGAFSLADRPFDPKTEKVRELTHAYNEAARMMEEEAAAAREERKREARDFDRAARREGTAR